MTRPLAVALFALIAGLASAQVAADAPAAQHVRALTGRGAAQTDAAIEIAKLRDADADMAIQALLDRKLHTYVDASGETVAVVPGEPDADGRLPLRRAYGGDPVLDAAGAQLTVPQDALTAVSAGRKLRKLGRELLRLNGPDPQARRSAAFFLGRQQDDTITPLLLTARDSERAKWTLRGIDEAIEITRLADDDPRVRIRAVERLAGLHSLYALNEFGKALDAGSEKDANVAEAMGSAVARIERWGILTTVVQTTWNGLSLASILAVIAVGLAITFGLMKVINMAHGELMLVGAYATYVVQAAFKAVLPASAFAMYPILAIPIAFVTAALLGVIIEHLIVRHLYGRPLDTLLATFGVSLGLQQLARHTFGAQNVDIASPAWLSGGWQIITGVVLPYNRLYILALSIACIAGTYFVLLRSGAGLRIRAVTQNRQMSACLGIATRKVDRWTFAFGSGLAGVGGCALSQLGNVGPDLGQTYIIDAFMVVVLGGVGKLAGVICGAFMIGGGNKVLEGMTSSPVAGKVLVLVALILFLQKRPLGIFPDKGRHEESA
jgi:urea transport system permease protein